MAKKKEDTMQGESPSPHSHARQKRAAHAPSRHISHQKQPLLGERNILIVAITILVVAALAIIFKDNISFFFKDNLSSSFSGLGSGAGDASDAVATVNGYRITREELDLNYNLEVPPLYQGTVSKKQYLEESFVPQILIYVEAEKQGFGLTQEQSKQKLMDALDQVGASITMVTDQLDEKNITFDQYLSALSKKIAITEFLNSTTSAEPVTDDQARQFYDDNKAMLFTRNSTEIPFDEVKDSIKLALQAESQRLAFASYVGELNKSAEIKIDYE